MFKIKIPHIFHRWQPVKVFDTRIVDDSGSTLRHRHDLTGLVCSVCKRRKIIRVVKLYSPSAGAVQNAFDWLNEKSAIDHLERCLKLGGAVE